MVLRKAWKYPNIKRKLMSGACRGLHRGGASSIFTKPFSTFRIKPNENEKLA